MTDSIPLSQLEPSPSAFVQPDRRQAHRHHHELRTTPADRPRHRRTQDLPRWFPDDAVDHHPRARLTATPVLCGPRAASSKSSPARGESMLNAIGTAVQAANATSLDIGGQLAVAFTGEGEAKTTTFNKPKLYTAQYKPPAPQAASVPVADLFS